MKKPPAGTSDRVALHLPVQRRPLPDVFQKAGVEGPHRAASGLGWMAFVPGQGEDSIALVPGQLPSLQILDDALLCHTASHCCLTDLRLSRPSDSEGTASTAGCTAQASSANGVQATPANLRISAVGTVTSSAADFPEAAIARSAIYVPAR